MKDSRATCRASSGALRPRPVPRAPSPAPLAFVPRPLGVLGRDRELATLAERFHATRESGAELLVLTGASGVGKTALASRFAERMRRAGHTVLEARCEKHRAYAPFASLVQQALDRLRGMGRPTPPAARWLACADGCCGFWFEHEAHGEEAAPGQARASTEARERRLRFFSAVEELLRALAAEGPPMLLLHELQDADEATRELLAFLLEGGRESGQAIGPGWSLPAFFLATAPTLGALGLLDDVTRVAELPLSITES